MEFERLPNRRKVIWIGDEKLQIAVADGGGHIAALRFPGIPEIPNPFWQPPWPSIEPDEVTDSIVNEQYGGAPEGRLLASILGHSLALDLYGAPSKAETLAGAVTHGKAGILPWQWTLSDPQNLKGECEDTFAQLKFSRQLCVKEHCVVIEERIQNLCAWDRPIAWQQHVSLGAPFCEEGFWSRANCDRGSTHPQTFGAGASLVPGSETIWPLAPRRMGGYCDYRSPLDADSFANDFTGYRIKPSDRMGSFVAGNTNFGFALFYVWPRQFFPWLGLWDEKHARQSNPWNKNTSVRAYEFGVSPFPESRQEMLDRSPLFDLPTYLMLPGGGTLWVRYLLGVFPDVSEPADLVFTDETATLVKDGRELDRVKLTEACASSERTEMAGK